MLNYNKAFSSFSTNNLEKTEAFYRDTLGLSVHKKPMGFLEVQTQGNQPLVIYPKPDHVPAVFTVFHFEVDNIEKTVDLLTAKGVVFEQYEGTLQTDEKGICRGEEGPWIAWFKDPGGNILAVLEERP